MKRFISIILLVLTFFLIPQAYSEHMKLDMPFSEFSPEQQEKIISKCMDYDRAGSLNLLKNEEPDMYLLCMELIIDEKTKEN